MIKKILAKFGEKSRLSSGTVTTNKKIYARSFKL